MSLRKAFGFCPEGGMCPNWAFTGNLWLPVGVQCGVAMQPEVMGTWTRAKAKWTKGSGQTEEPFWRHQPVWKVRRGGRGLGGISQRPRQVGTVKEQCSRQWGSMCAE